jgi:hypothetical protein
MGISTKRIIAAARLTLAVCIAGCGILSMQGTANALAPTCPAGSILWAAQCLEDVSCPAGYFPGGLIFTSTGCCPNGTTAEGPAQCVSPNGKISLAISATCAKGFKWSNADGACTQPAHCPSGWVISEGNCQFRIRRVQ